MSAKAPPVTYNKITRMMTEVFIVTSIAISGSVAAGPTLMN
jgi:hypothetical protein